MLLPRGETILENTKVRFFDFDSLLADEFESTFKNKEKITGYVSIGYHDRKDVLIIFEGKIREGIRFVPGKGRTKVPVEEVLDYTKKDFEGVVHYYKTSADFLNMLWHSFIATPIQGPLTSEFINLEKYLHFLTRSETTGFLEIEQRGALGLYAYEKGKSGAEYYYHPIDVTAPSRVRLFMNPESYFISESDSMKLTFVDIFRDMLMTTYSIMVQAEDSQVALSKSLSLARKEHPVILRGVHTKKAGTIDFDILLTNLEEVSPSQKRDAFVNSFIEVLFQRLVMIGEIFGQEIVERTLKELKLVQIYHQRSLAQFGIGQTLLELWKRFERD